MLALEPDDGARSRATTPAADRLLVIARGFEYATAREWALKLKELAHVFADPYSAADFQHGPVALVEPGVPVIAIVRDGPTAAGLIELLARLREDLDAAARGRLGRAARRWPSRAGRSRSPPPPAEWLGPIATIVAGQLHALHLTIARGLDPDAPAQHPQGDADALRHAGRRARR